MIICEGERKGEVERGVRVEGEGGMSISDEVSGKRGRDGVFGN
jgi:hypothetical protein